MKFRQLLKSLFGAISFILITLCSYAQCTTIQPSGIFSPDDDVIMTTYHSTLARISSGYIAWGEDMDSDGTDANTIIDITPANGYNYTGSIINIAVSGNSGAQGFLSTTGGFYCWGQVGEVVDADFTGGAAFQAMTGVPFSPSTVLNMHASSDVLFVLLTTGEIWVASTGVTAPNGTDDTDGNIWHQVETSTGVPLTGALQLTGNKASGFALLASGDIYAWGNNIELGDGGGIVDLDFATLMVAPPSVPTYIASIFGDSNDPGLLVLGTDKKVYGVGDNTDGQIITTGTGVVSTWTAIQDASGTSDLTNVLFLATSHTSEDYPGAAVIVESIPPFNTILTWGQNETNSIAHPTNGNIQNPTIPPSFNVGVDEPAYVSVGGHATTFLNRAYGGTICFAGHISNGSTAGLTSGDGSTFECIVPTGYVLCGLSNAPVAIDDALTVNEDTTNVYVNVQVNDVDPNGDSLATSIVSGPTSGGSVSVINVDSLLYSPPANFTGMDTIVYAVCDTTTPVFLCDTAIVVITINPVNDPPSQGNETLTINEDDPATTSTDLTANNTDPDGT
ncbi:MAG: hypothetical protein HOB26_03515, partial [Flavobacteriales bacterium]|nr:hypothetical protein [Flavobacteriales bacterium]